MSYVHVTTKYFDTAALESLKSLATHGHFAASIAVFVLHFRDPPSMPVTLGFGIIVGTFLLAYLIPPIGMIKPEGMASDHTIRKITKTRERYVAPVEGQEEEKTASATAASTAAPTSKKTNNKKKSKKGQ